MIGCEPVHDTSLKNQLLTIVSKILTTPIPKQNHRKIVIGKLTPTLNFYFFLIHHFCSDPAQSLFGNP